MSEDYGGYKQAGRVKEHFSSLYKTYLIAKAMKKQAHGKRNKAGRLFYWLLALFEIGFFRKPSYAELLEERKKLKECVLYWKYPDGTQIPQHKRQRMFRDLRILSHKIRSYSESADNE
jgi:hypothetical protein